MAFGGSITSRLAAVVAALATLLALALVALGPSADTADARNACSRFGDRPANALRKAPARSAVVCLVNKARRNHGLPRLRDNRRLRRAAQRHTNVMVSKRCFAHECPGEASLTSRLRSARYLTGGLLAWAYGENIAWGEGGRSTPRSIVASWMNSPGHRANILSRTFRHIGIGVHGTTPYGGKGGTYTADFGLRRG